MELLLLLILIFIAEGTVIIFVIDCELCPASVHPILKTQYMIFDVLGLYKTSVDD